MEPPSARHHEALSLSGWGALLACGLLGLGGAARLPSGWLVGIAGAYAVIAGLITVAACRAIARREDGAPLAGLWPILILSCSGLALPGAAALTGRPLLALSLAGVVVLLAGARWRPPSWAFLPAVFVLYALVSWRVQEQVGPQGDEPHYLMVADSLLRDHDLSLERDYAEERYRPFVDGPLRPHYRVRGKGGEIYSLHAVGLSLLILPAYALGGYPAASFFMALVGALLAREIRSLVHDAFGREALAEGLAWLAALSPPLLHYAGLVFSEVPAALLVAASFRRAGKARDWGASDALLVGAMLAVLPWLNVRYALLCALIAIYALAQRPSVRALTGLLAPAAVSLVGLLAYHQALYGFYDPRLVYGRRPEFALATLAEGLPGLLLDQEFGLLVYAPIFVLAVPGLVLLARVGRLRALALGLCVLGVLLTAGTWHMWRGGWNPPARFLVPVIPLLVLAVAAAVGKRMTPAVAVLAGIGLFVGAVGAKDPRLVHRDRDGTAPLWREASGAEEWTRLLPAYVLADPDRHRLALVWGVALAAAALARGRMRPATVALTSLGLLAAAGAASSLSHARTQDRDAVRLVGRPALEAPAFRLVRPAGAVWLGSDLAMGPLYEPHRFPQGAELGARLPLPAGEYRLLLEGEDLAPNGPSPTLEVAAEGRHPTPPRQETFRRTGEGLETTFAVAPGEVAISLRIRGGSAFRVERLRIEP